MAPRAEATKESAEALDNLKALADELEAVRAEEAQVWEKSKDAIKSAYNEHPAITYDVIAQTFKFTRARVYQLVTGKRWKKKVAA